MPKRYWLFKTEPENYAFSDLERDGTTCWEGIRNYQARNLLRDEVRVGDSVLIYHSRVSPMVIPGTAKVVKAAYPDDTQFDPKSKYYDAKAKEDDPPWLMVDVKLDESFAHPVDRDQMRTMKALADMMVLKRGARLSIQPVTAAEFKAIVKRGRGK